MKILLGAGARPNFMKIAPVIRAINAHNATIKGNRIEPFLVHTGQHYDYEMSQVFFQDLELPKPDIHLNIGSGSHAQQTGKVLIEFEKVLLEEKPDLVIAVGDVNSTLAAALAAVKIHIPVAYIEAGLRLFDLSTLEEVNRLLTDHVSDYLFTPSRSADENLKREGIASNYALLTLHRPDNVDDEATFLRLISAMKEISRKIPIVFPIHPRTQKTLRRLNLDLNQGSKSQSNIKVISPLGYLDFLNLMMNARFVLTDSGGMQAEATILNIPCLTLYRHTAWEVTVTQGTNILVGTDPKTIIQAAFQTLNA